MQRGSIYSEEGHGIAIVTQFDHAAHRASSIGPTLREGGFPSRRSCRCPVGDLRHSIGPKAGDHMTMPVTDDGSNIGLTRCRRRSRSGTRRRTVRVEDHDACVRSVEQADRRHGFRAPQRPATPADAQADPRSAALSWSCARRVETDRRQFRRPPATTGILLIALFHIWRRRWVRTAPR